MPLANYTVEGSLSLGGVNMNREAWAVLGDERGQGGLVKLWVEFDVRGQDRVLPSATGVIAYPRRLTVTRIDLRILVVGDVDETGAPNADATIGLEENIEYIRSNVLAPVVSSTGTRAAVLTMPSGGTRTGDVHVLGMQTQTYQLSSANGCDGALMIGTLQLSLPSGRLS